MNDAGTEGEVEIWGMKVRARAVSPEADAFLSDVLGRPVRLYRHQPQWPRVQNHHGVDIESRFPDLAPVQVVNMASLTAVSQAVGYAVDPARFRSNVFVSGFDAWAEESWTGVRIGEVELAKVRISSRCKVITIDRTTGESEGPAVLEALKNKVKGPRARPQFGVDFRVLKGGIIRAGDRVEPLL